MNITPDHPEILSSELGTHPWELAQSTLENLLGYSPILEEMSHRAADLIQKDQFFESFAKLIDGIDLFAQGIDGVKRILKSLGPIRSPELLSQVDQLEMELLVNLRLLLKSQEEKDQKSLEEILRYHLPQSLKEWKENGIPSLIRARDC